MPLFILLPDWNEDLVWDLPFSALGMKFLFCTLSVQLEIINFQLELKIKYFHTILAQEIKLTPQNFRVVY